MLRPRIIPSLLVHQGGLIKTVNFGSPKYVGDPINAVKIFNEKEADELVVWDIDASVEGHEPDYDLIAKLAAECRMPFCYGGGITRVDQAQRIIDLGVEKVSLSAAAIEDMDLVSAIADAVGRQSVVGVVDYRKKSGLLSRGNEVVTHNGRKAHKRDPLDLARELASAGVGEVVFNSVSRDGAMQGYDLDLAGQARATVNVPITFVGGAGSFDDISALIRHCGVVGAAAGSLFVFKGPYRAVLINYPSPEQKDEIFRAAGLPL